MTKTKKDCKRESVQSQGTPQALFAQIGPEKSTQIANKNANFAILKEIISYPRSLFQRYIIPKIMEKNGAYKATQATET